jgi:hypothetical protein
VELPYVPHRCDQSSTNHIYPALSPLRPINASSEHFSALVIVHYLELKIEARWPFIPALQQKYSTAQHSVAFAEGGSTVAGESWDNVAAPAIILVGKKSNVEPWAWIIPNPKHQVVSL